MCSEHTKCRPNFQRYFDWGKNDIRDLLESIYYDYFVGSLLLWETKDVLELDVINIKGVQETNVKPKNIILDGQQRITSIYYAIKSPEFNLKDTSVPIFFYIDFKKSPHLSSGTFCCRSFAVLGLPGPSLDPLWLPFSGIII